MFLKRLKAVVLFWAWIGALLLSATVPWQRPTRTCLHTTTKNCSDGRSGPFGREIFWQPKSTTVSWIAGWLCSCPNCLPTTSWNRIEIEEELILAPFGLGHSLIYLHRYAEALEALERGLKTYPDWANSHPSLLFFQDPLFTGPVVSDLEERMKASSDPVHWLVHGYIQFFSENFRQASRSFSQALSADKGSFMAGYFSGQIPIAQRKTESAKLQQFKDLDADKLEPDALIDYGSSFFKNADYQTAAKLFKKAIDLDQKLPVVHIAYGDSLFALGRFDEATQAILTGLEIYPKYAENPINRREFYNNPSEFDRQLRNLENYVNTHPSNLNARFLLGYNYFFTQAYEKAEEQLKAVLSSESLHSSAQYLSGLIQRFSTQKPGKSL